MLNKLSRKGGKREPKKTLCDGLGIGWPTRVVLCDGVENSTPSQVKN